MGITCYCGSLRNLYYTWSLAKEAAYNRCYQMYMETENREAFGVGNANTFGFTASWLGTMNGEDIMRVETKDNSYLVWLNR